MTETFEAALAALLAEYKDTPREEVISALELQIYALKEEAEDE
jgi:hypothetical protein